MPSNQARPHTCSRTLGRIVYAYLGERVNHEGHGIHFPNQTFCISLGAVAKEETTLLQPNLNCVEGSCVVLVPKRKLLLFLKIARSKRTLLEPKEGSLNLNLNCLGHGPKSMWGRPCLLWSCLVAQSKAFISFALGTSSHSRSSMSLSQLPLSSV